MTVKSLRLTTTLFVSALSINSAMALPIDWTGVFGVDSHNISNTCRTSDKIRAAEKPDIVPNPGTNPQTWTGTRTGTQALRSDDCGASFQTYTLRLNPQIIINDAVTLKGELSSGYLRGGQSGGDATNSLNGTGNSYFFNTPAQRSALNVNQIYMELYADTALIKVGRMARGFGTGMIFSDGRGAWDRFLTMYDGIDAEMKIGDFSVAPYFAKISSYNTNTNRDDFSGSSDVRELGVVAKYDNKNRDFIASLQFAKRSSEPQNTFYNANGTNVDATHPAYFSRGSTSVTIIEPYLSKRWNKLKVVAEGSIQTGDYGHVYDTQTNSKYSANAYLLDAKYDLNPKWDIGFLAGQVSGDKGSTSKFEAAYLNPNFHIADLMFRYNYAGFSEGGRSIFDASITNAQFFKLYGNYKTDKWTWKAAAIMATALQTAKAGPGTNYHHEEGYAYEGKAGSKKQAADYGYELDLGFDYRWNPNVIISGYYAYWMVGDFYAYNNDAKDVDVASVHGGGLRATLEF